MTYVSRSLLDLASADAGVNAIIETSRMRNATDGITGALIFSGTHFAQTLEGRADLVRALMAKIAADPRHTDVTVVSQATITHERDYESWSMAYNGRTTFVQRHIGAVYEAQPHANTELRTLMRGLSGTCLL